MRLALLAAWLALPTALAGQEAPHVHGGHAACYADADWRAQEAAYRQGDVREWNRVMRPLLSEGRCWMTEAGTAYEIAGSDVDGTVRIRVRADPRQKEGPAPWAYVARRAIGQ